MLYAQFIEQLKRSFFPVIVIEGDDAYLREDALERLKEKLDISLPELNVTLRDGGDISVAEVVALANSFPVMSDKRLIVLRDFLSEKKFIDLKDKVFARFLEYCNTPNETTCLVLIYGKAKAPFKINATYVDCSKMDLYAVSAWIRTEVEKKNKTIERSLADKIAEYCDCDMYRVFQSVAKLSAYCEKNIDVQAVELLVPKDIEVVIFELANAICEGRFERALEVCRKLLLEEEPSKIMGSIYSGFRRMFFATGCSLSDDALSDKLGVKPYSVKKAREQGEKFGIKKLKSALTICADSDMKLKNFYGNEKAIITDLVLSLCNL